MGERQIFMDAVAEAIEHVNDDTRVILPALLDLYNPSNPGHFHPNAEIFIPLSGVTHFQCPGATFESKPGQVILMPAGVSHQETVLTRPELLTMVVCFRDEGLYCLLCDAKEPGDIGIRFSLQYESKVGQELDQMLRYAVRSCDAKGGKRTGFFRLVIQAVLSQILELLQGDDLADEGENPLLLRIREYVRIHLSEPNLQVQVMASSLGCHPDYLSRLFSTEMGMSLVDYITRERLKMAKQLLRSSEMSVKQVAYACGYKYPAYFIRVFKQEVGQTPGEYASHSSI